MTILTTIAGLSTAYTRIEARVVALARRNAAYSASTVYCTDLTALTGTADRARVFCDGYSATGDGGGGEFVWYLGSTTTADGGTVFGAGTGRWKRVFSGSVVSPEWFGARGDGATDDTAAIQAAIAALATYSGIDFGSRTYYLGTRTGATDAPLRLFLDTLSDKTLVSSGATFTVQTTNQVLGYSPTLFLLRDCHRVNMTGRWNFIDTKTWSTYTSYGQTTSSPAANWSGFSGALPVWVTERCTDLTFGDFYFKKTRFGIVVGGTDGVTPADADRSSRITIHSLHAEDVSYGLDLGNNGDDLTCLNLVALNCMRGSILHGVSNVKISEHKINSIKGFGSVISRKARDTANIEYDMRYESRDGYPYQPMAVELTPTAGTGTPYIKGCRVKLSCKLTTLDAARERQAACIVLLYDTSAVEVGLDTYPDCIRGLELDIDKGEFEFPLQISPTADTTTSYPKLKMKLKLRDRAGGTYDVGISAVDTNAYVLAKKIAVDQPLFYEMVSSDNVESSYVYPVSGWGPWQDSTPANISLTNHTCNWSWVRTGALCQYTMDLTLGAGTIPAGNWYFRLPYVPSVGGSGSAPPLHEFGEVLIKDVSSGDIYKGHLKYNGSSYYPQAYMRLKDVAGTITHISQAVTGTAPFAFASGDTIRITCQFIIGRVL